VNQNHFDQHGQIRIAEDGVFLRPSLSKKEKIQSPPARTAPPAIDQENCSPMYVRGETVAYLCPITVFSSAIADSHCEFPKKICRKIETQSPGLPRFPSAQIVYALAVSRRPRAMPDPEKH